MIIKELYLEKNNGEKLFRTYSDLNLKIRKTETGEIYEEAIDIEGVDYTYKETDEQIEVLYDFIPEDINI